MSTPTRTPQSHRARRVPENSVLFNYFVPALFILFALMLIVIVLFSVGVLTGLIHYQ